MPSDCIFCRIAGGEIPSQKVYEDERVLAFLDIGPLAQGHTLLIPKAHAEQIDQLSPQDAAHIGGLLPRIAAAVRAAMNVPALNILQNNGRESGQAVLHVHFHFIPRTEGDGLGYRWNAGKYPPGRIDQVREDIRAAII